MGVDGEEDSLKAGQGAVVSDTGEVEAGDERDKAEDY